MKRYFPALTCLSVWLSFLQVLWAKPGDYRSYEMLRGFVIEEGTPMKSGALLHDDSILYCEDYCVVVDRERELRINFRGFGRFSTLRKFQQVVIEPVAEATAKAPRPAEQEKPPESKEKIRKVVLEAEESKLFPRPKKSSILLHISGGKISIIPRERCRSNCELKIDSVLKGSYTESFSRGDTPKALWEFAAGEEDSIYWQFQDGELQDSGQFEILLRSSESIQKALESGQSVDFIN